MMGKLCTNDFIVTLKLKEISMSEVNSMRFYGPHKSLGGGHKSKYRAWNVLKKIHLQLFLLLDAKPLTQYCTCVSVSRQYLIQI